MMMKQPPTTELSEGSVPMFYGSCTVMSLGPVSSQILQTWSSRRSCQNCESMKISQGIITAA